MPDLKRFVKMEKKIFRTKCVRSLYSFQMYLRTNEISKRMTWLKYQSACCLSSCPSVRPPLRGSRELCWELHGAPFFKMSSLEQRLSRIEEKLKQENEEARRRIDLNIDMSPQRSRPRPSEWRPGRTGVSETGQISRGKARSGGGGNGGRWGVVILP